MHPPSPRFRHRNSQFWGNRCTSVKSFCSEVWFRRDCRRDIINEVSGEGIDSKGLDVCNRSKTRRVGLIAAWMEGKRLAMTVLTVLPSVCGHCWHPLSLFRQNRARKLKLALQNIWRPRQSCRTVLTPLSDNMDSCFCSPSRLVFAGPKFTKNHGTKSPWGRLGQSSFTPTLVHFQNLQGMYKL